MENSPKKSIVKLSQEGQLSVGICHTILKKELQIYGYKTESVLELRPLDEEQHIAVVFGKLEQQ
jgi:hypothetical protein